MLALPGLNVGVTECDALEVVECADVVDKLELQVLTERVRGLGVTEWLPAQLDVDEHV